MTPPAGPEAANPSQHPVLQAANLSADRAAALIALADGLAAIGQLREGRRAGQFSIFNFLLRAAEDTDAPLRDGRAPLVVFMRAGIFRRHLWYLRAFLAEDSAPLRVELPAPIDRDWDWWSDLEEIRGRLAHSDGWSQAVGAEPDAHIARIGDTLARAEVVRLDTGRPA